MNLHTKKKIFRRLFFTLIAVGALIFATFKIIKYANEKTNAISVSGDGIVVSYDPNAPISYGSKGYVTHRFNVYTIKDDENYTGYCANPSARSLSGSDLVVYRVDEDESVRNDEAVQLIKMAIFADTAGGPLASPEIKAVANALKDEMFVQVGSDMAPDKKYAYTHALIGYKYARDLYGLTEEDTWNIYQMEDNLQAARDRADNDAYVMAQAYSLYVTYKPDGDYRDDEYQSIVWIEAPGYGHVDIEKKDAQTGTPQGDANLADITFAAYADERIFDFNSSVIYEKGEVVASGTTNNEGKLTLNLPLGKYIIRETAGNAYYNVTSTEAGATVLYEAHDIDREFDDYIKTGNVTVKKVDSATGTCSSLAKANLAGATFRVVNKSAQPVYYNGVSHAYGQEVVRGTVNSQCSVTFTNLPYATYEISEVGAGTGYLTNVIPQTVTIANYYNPQNIVLTFENKIIRGDVKFIKKDDRTNNPMANILFEITSKTTGEKHRVVTNNSGVVDTRASVIPHTTNTNGYDNITYDERLPGLLNGVTYLGYGTWFNGGSTSVEVDNSLGALPYDDYEIVEKSCIGNIWCYDIPNQKKSFSITSEGQVVDLGTWENDCVEPKISTTASDNADGDKYVTAATNAQIRDRVSYTLMKGKTYTVNGALYDKNTGQPLNITKSMTVTPTTEDGYNDMVFDINTASLGGHTIVVYEEIYYDGQLVVSHKDINDANQSVLVVSLGTTASDNADGDKIVIANTDAVIKDDVNYCLVPGKTMRLEATLWDKETNSLVKDSSGNIVKSSKNITVGSSSPCGSTTMNISFDASELGGHDLVVFEAAYLDNALVTTHNDANDEGQTVTMIDIRTTAVDVQDGDEYVLPASNTVIDDQVRACLKKDMTFRIEGYLILKDPNGGADIELEDEYGQLIRRSMRVTPRDGNCANVTMVFPVNTEDLVGRDIVIYEDVWLGDTLLLTHRDINDDRQTASVISVGTTATDNEDDDKFILAGRDTAVKDTVEYCLRAGRTYEAIGTLMNKATGEPLLDAAGDPIRSSTVFVPSKNCGTVEVVIPFNSSNLVGTDIVVFESIEETRDDGNVHTIIVHEDINDEGQTVSVVGVSTVAVDKEDGDKFVRADKKSVIKDTVRYCLSAGETYTVRGVLMDKETGKPVLGENDKAVTSETEFTVTEACGEVSLDFKLDTTSEEFGGKEIVVFEYIYYGEELVASHEDLEDEAQTVRVISFKTYAVNSADGTKDFYDASGEIEIKDTVTYCLVAGTEFTTKSRLVNSETGEPITVDGQPLEKTVPFTPETNCGEIDIFYRFDVKDILTTTSIVILEDVYIDGVEEPIFSFHDLNNADETVTVHITDVPDTGFMTASEDSSATTKSTGYYVVVSALGAMLVVVMFTIRKYVKDNRR